MKKPLIAILIVSLLLSACSGINEVSNDTTGQENTLPPFAEIEGFISIDGDAYIPFENGSVKSITGEVYETVMTPDREHVVVLETDGILSVYTGDAKSTIAEDVRSIELVTNEAVVYSRMKNKGKYYLPGDYSYTNYEYNVYSYAMHSFANGSYVPIAGNYEVREGTVLFEKQSEEIGDYELHLMKANETDSTVVRRSEYEFGTVGVNRDGSVYVWSEFDDKVLGEMTVWICCDEERQKVASGDENWGWQARFNDKGDFAVIYTSITTEVKELAIWTAENGIQSVKLPDSVSSPVYVGVGNLRIHSDVEAQTFYLSIHSGESEYGSVSNLYAISLDGNREKIASGILDFEIRNNRLYYINDDCELYTAVIDDTVTTDEVKIADEVFDMRVSPDGESVAFARNVASDQIGSLFYYDIDMEKPIRIETESYCYAYYSSYTNMWSHNMHTYFSADGDTLYFFKDVDEIASTYIESGTLMQYDISKDESTRIGSEVLVDLEGEYEEGYLGKDGIYYCKYIQYDEETGLIRDLMYWDGQESALIVEEVKK